MTAISQGILLVDHGSTRAESNHQLENVVTLVQLQCPSDVIVAGAHMELAPPSIRDQVDHFAAIGVTQLIVIPYFLAPGRHAREDIPRLVHEATVAYPYMVVRVGACLGVDDLLAQLVLKRAVGAGLKLV